MIYDDEEPIDMGHDDCHICEEARAREAKRTAEADRPRWISVESQLPRSYSMTVLVRGEYLNEHAMTTASYSSNDQDWVNYEGVAVSFTVTHWRELTDLIPLEPPDAKA